MNCANFEALLADFLDGTLPSGERAAFEAHAADCAACREFQSDVVAGMALTDSAPGIEPPNELITRIAYQAPLGRSREPLDRQGLVSRMMSRWVQPLLQPRLAMGMAMTILSFAMLERCTGIRVQHIETADLNPVKIWQDVEDRGVRLKDRAVKYYENLRFVYDIEVRLREMEDQQATVQDEARRRRSRANNNKAVESGGAAARAATPKGESK